MSRKEQVGDIVTYENILNTFYRYYSNLREDIWHRLTKLNQTNNKNFTYGKNFYLYKAQKLIDRIIFIRFCKEKGALEAECIDSYFFNLQNLVSKKHEADFNLQNLVDAEHKPNRLATPAAFRQQGGVACEPNNNDKIENKVENIEKIERINVEKDYPAIYEHLLKYKDQLEKRTDKGTHWTNLRDCAYCGDFDNSRLIWQEIVYNSSFCYTEDIIYPEATTFVMTGKNLKYLLVLLNSKPCTWAFKTFYAGGGLGSKGFRYKKMFLEKLPIPIIPQDAQKPFEEKAEAMLKLNKDLKTHSSQMVEFLVDKFLPYHKPKSKKQALEEFEALKTDTDYNKSIPEINRVANHNNSLAKKLNKDMQETLGEEDIYKLKSKLSKWYETGFNLASVFEVLQKFNIIVPSKEQFAFSLEFNDTFTTKAKECQSLQTQISVLDKEIDQMVYKLYGLTREEIEVVEG